ncbi:hypothetical protein ACHAWX_001191 [Stephanocyclus meneghinianus]
MKCSQETVQIIVVHANSLQSSGISQHNNNINNNNIAIQLSISSIGGGSMRRHNRSTCSGISCCDS